jgi:hypothetical protein
MEPQTSSWSRDLVLDDSLTTLREATLRRLAPAGLVDGLVAGGPGKTSLTWSPEPVPAGATVADRDGTDRY